MAELNPEKMPVFSSLPEESKERVRESFRRLRAGGNIKAILSLSGSPEQLVEFLSLSHTPKKED